MSAGPGKLRRNLSDAALLYALPLLVGLLPWRAGLALLRAIAARTHFFADVVEAAWAQATRTLPGLERTEFCRAQRLLLLVDRCDAMLCLLRSRRWWARRIDVRGAPLEALAPGLVLTSHWGSGNWLWGVLAGRGVRGHFLARRAGVTDLGRGRLARGYPHWRAWALRRSGAAGVIYTGGAAAPVLAALARDEAVVGMLDLVPRAGQQQAAVTLLGRRAMLPTGLLGLAARAGATVMLVSCGLDARSGRRVLHLERLPDGLAPEAVLARYTAHLDARIREAPGYWFAWPQAAALLAAPEPAGPGPDGSAGPGAGPQPRQ